MMTSFQRTIGRGTDEGVRRALEILRKEETTMYDRNRKKRHGGRKGKR
jgi:hypothetical protein